MNANCRYPSLDDDPDLAIHLFQDGRVGAAAQREKILRSSATRSNLSYAIEQEYWRHLAIFMRREADHFTRNQSYKGPTPCLPIQGIRKNSETKCERLSRRSST